MIWQLIQSFIRHTLSGAGAALVTKGLATQSDADTAVGAIMVLIAFGHSIYVKWKAAKSPQPAASVSVKSGPIVLLMVFCFAIAGWTGCQNTSPQQATYEVAGTAVVSVDTAMNLWGAYVAADQPGTNAELAVEKAYDDYQASMAVVCDAGAAYAATGGTNATATAALNQAIANSSTELTDLENLITSYGVKLQ